MFRTNRRKAIKTAFLLGWNAAKRMCRLRHAPDHLKG